MKKLFKLFLPILVLAMLVGALAIAVAAETATETEDPWTYKIYVDDTLATTSNDAALALKALGTAGKTTEIHLNGDLTLTTGEAAQGSLSGNVIIYLNGHMLTLGKNTGDNKYYRYNVASSGSLTVYGGNGEDGDSTTGKFNSPSGASMFFSGASSKFTIGLVNVEVTTGGTLADYRGGTFNMTGGSLTNTGTNKTINFAGDTNANATATFKNVVINQNNGGTHVFEVGHESRKGYSFDLAFNDCTFNTSATSLFKHMWKGTDDPNNGKNCEISLNGCTVNAQNSSIITTVADTCHTKVVLGLNTTLYVKADTAGTYVNTVVSPVSADYVRAFVDSTSRVKVVASQDAFNVTYKNGDTVLGTRLMAKGVAPVWTSAIAETYALNGNDSLVCTMHSGWYDGDTKVDAVSSELTLTAGFEVKNAYWAAYSAVPHSVDNLVFAAHSNSNLNGYIQKSYAYVTLYEDCILDDPGSASVINVNKNLVLDLNGKKLTMGENAASDYAFKPAKNVTFIIKNGTVEVVKSRLAYPWSSGETLTVEDCTLIVNEQTLIDCRSNNITVNFKNTDIDMRGKGGNQLFVLNNNGGAQSATYNFENVNIYSSTGTTSSNRLFWFNRPQVDNNATVNLTNFNVAFGFTTAIFGFETTRTAGTACTVVADGVYINALDKTPKLFETGKANTSAYGTVVLKMKGDFGVANEAIWNTEYQGAVGTLVGEEFTAITAGKTAFIAQLEGTPYYTYTDSYQTETWTYGDKTLGTVTAAGVYPYLPLKLSLEDNGRKYLAELDHEKAGIPVATAGENKSYTVTADMFSKLEGVNIAMLDASGNVVAYESLKTLPGNYFNAKGAYTYVLYSDLTVDSIATVTVKGGTVIDLNGFVLDNDSAGSTSNRFACSGAFTVKNGTIKSNHNYVYLDSAGSVATFEDVTFLQYGSAVSFDVRNGTLNLIRCSLSKENYRPINLGYRGGSQTVNLTDCNFAVQHLIGILPLMREAADKPQLPAYKFVTDVNIVGGTYTLTGNLAYVMENVSSEATLDVSVKDAKVSCGATPLNIQKPCTVTVTYDNTWLDYDPNNSGNEYVTATVAEGQKVLTTSNETYGYRVAKVTLPISANLTLFSDFNLNVFLGNNVVSVVVNGKELELQKFDESIVKASVTGIAAAKAAENTVFTVSYVEGGVTYTVEYSYSVIKYAEALLGSSYSAESKALVASAVDYVSKAYTYAGNSNDTLADLVANESYKAILDTASDLTKDTIVAGNNYSNLNVAIYSAALTLSNDYKYVVDFVDTYTGTVTVNGVSYTVVDGKVNGKDTVTVTLRGYEFNDGLTVTATTENGTVEGTYTLADYVKAMADGENESLDALLVALYNFTVEAEEYKAYADANGLK